MKIVIPQRIQTVTTLLIRTNEKRLLGLVLRDQNNLAIPRGLTAAMGNFAKDVFGRIILDRLGGIEAQTIQVKFINPVDGIRLVEVTHRAAVLAVEVDSIAPIV